MRVAFQIGCLITALSLAVSAVFALVTINQTASLIPNENLESTETLTYVPRQTIKTLLMPPLALQPLLRPESKPQLKPALQPAPTPLVIQPATPKTIQPLNPLVFVSLDCRFQNTNIISRGSGVIIRSDGLILTNRHVATYVDPDGTDRQNEYPTERCAVGTSASFNQPPEEIYQASLFWSATTTSPKNPSKIAFDHDFAFLKIDKLLLDRTDCLKNYPTGTELCSKYPETLPTSFTALAPGNIQELQKGSQITVIGYPSEFSKDNKLFQVAGPIQEIYTNVIDASAPVEKGFSGSAVLNQYNELIGLLIAGKTGSLAEFIRLDWIQQNNPVWK